MEILSWFWDNIKPILPTGAAILGIILVLYGLRLVLEKKYASKGKYQSSRQIITLVVFLFGLLIIILVMPISDTSRGQLLSLIGILLSAIIALSSTTFVGNAMAGMMLRAVKSFRPGDFIRVKEHFGRVSERGLFHIEIQTEDRDLTTLPNLYLVTNPVKVIRSSGTVVTAEVSLGYDNPRKEVERCLMEAATAIELQEPFVHVMELGDFSIRYRVAGLLTEVKHLISMRSRLREAVIDKLHEGGIEIVSPTFMNTRALPAREAVIPETSIVDMEERPSGTQVTPERILFDKADQAESLEKLHQRKENIIKDMGELKSRMEKATDEQEVSRLKEEIERLKTWLERLSDHIKRREEEEKEEN